MRKSKSVNSNPLDAVIVYFFHCIWEDLLQILTKKRRDLLKSDKQYQSAQKATSFKLQNREEVALDALVALLLHYIWVDLQYILEEYKKKRDIFRMPMPPGPTQSDPDFVKLIHKMEQVPAVLLKCVTVHTFRLVWFLTFSKICSAHWVFAGARKRVSSDIEAIVDQLHVITNPLVEFECEFGRSHQIRQMKMIVVAVIITIIQLRIPKTGLSVNHNLAQQHNAAFAEIDCLQYTLNPATVIPRVHFEHDLYFYQHKLKSFRPSKRSIENFTAPLLHEVSLLFIVNASLSNSADTAGLKLSSQESMFSLLISVSVMILEVVILSPVVETMPTINEVEKEASHNRKARSGARSFVVELKGGPNTGYCAEMTFGGVSDQQFCMLVDTGSANLAIAAQDLPGIKEHLDIEVASSTLVQTNKPVSVSYSGGEWSGTLATDLVSIGRSPQIEAQFALITSSSMFFIPGAPWVGILGLAYDKLAKPDSSVKPFWSVLQEYSGLEDMFALRLCPPINFVNQNGIMEFGDISDHLYVGSILYTSIVQEMYYNVIVTNLTVGKTQIALPCSEFNNDKAIVDSGTTDIYLPSRSFAEVVKEFKRHFEENVPVIVPESFWSGSSKLAWPTAEKQSLLEAFPPFFIGFAEDDDPSSEFALAVTSQIYLRQVSGSQQEREETKCLPECDFFVFGIKRREKGLVIGGNVMLGFTTIFDRQRKRMGFARSSCQYSDTTPTHVPYIIGPFPRDPVDCVCYGCSTALEYWEYITYSCGVIVALVSILSIGYAIVKRCQKISHVSRKVCDTCCRRRYMLSSTDEDSYVTANAMESEQSSVSKDSGVDHSNEQPFVYEAAAPMREINPSVKESSVILSRGAETEAANIAFLSANNYSLLTCVPNGPVSSKNIDKDPTAASYMLPHKKLMGYTVSVIIAMFSLPPL